MLCKVTQKTFLSLSPFWTRPSSACTHTALSFNKQVDTVTHSKLWRTRSRNRQIFLFKILAILKVLVSCKTALLQSWKCPNCAAGFHGWSSQSLFHSVFQFAGCSHTAPEPDAGKQSKWFYCVNYLRWDAARCCSLLSQLKLCFYFNVKVLPNAAFPVCHIEEKAYSWALAFNEEGSFVSFHEATACRLTEQKTRQRQQLARLVPINLIVTRLICTSPRQQHIQVCFWSGMLSGRKTLVWDLLTWKSNYLTWQDTR